MYLIKVFDPKGRFVGTTGRRYWFRWTAKRDMRFYELGDGFTVAMDGRQVPLCNFRVEKVS